MPAAAKKAYLAFDESDDSSEELERLRQKLARRPKSPSVSSSSSDGDCFSADHDGDDDDKELCTSKHWAGKDIVVKLSPPADDTRNNANTTLESCGTTTPFQPKENNKKSSDASPPNVAASLDATSSSSSSSSSSCCDSSEDDDDNSLSLEGNGTKFNGLTKSSAPPMRPTVGAKHQDGFLSDDDSENDPETVIEPAVLSATVRQAVPQRPAHAVAAPLSSSNNAQAAGNSYTPTASKLSPAAPLEDCDGDDEFPDFDEAALAALELQIQNHSTAAVPKSTKDDFDDDNFPDLGKADLEALDKVVACHPNNTAPSESAQSTPVMSNRSPVRNPYQKSRYEVASPAVHDSLINSASASPIVHHTSAPPTVNGIHHDNHTCSYEDGDASGDEWHYQTIDDTEKENSADNSISYSLQFDEDKLDAFGFEIEQTGGQLGDASTATNTGSGRVDSGNSGKEPVDHRAVPPTHLEERASERFQGDQPRSASEPKGTDVEFDDAFDFGSPSPSIEDDDEAQPTQESRKDNVKSEIHPSFYAPEPRDAIQEPIVHKFSPRNRPVHARLSIPVAEVFDSPANTLWKNKFETFNQLQSELANMLAYSDDNVIVSAPTGAGKTAVFEMAMARFFQVDYQNAQTPGRPVRISKRRKIVYVSPSKALCDERFEDWSQRLAAMNLSIEVAVITGDQDPSEAFGEFSSAHFILTTPEKMDSLTRKWTEHFFLFASVKLFMVDEVHLIADESRGCCLEAIVLRMKTIQQAASRLQVTQEELSASSYANTTPDAINSPLRFVAVSATLPNISDIATFFEANEAHTFDESYRPVPLTTHVIGQGRVKKDSSSQWHFWKNLDRNVPEIIMRFSEGRPSIVFCHSKAGTENLANLLAAAHTIGRRDANTPVLASQTRVAKLQRVLMYGIAYHHAGLEVEDRRLVEKAFHNHKIRVVCATSTLAMGVNLPSHLVVINGTKAWRGGEHGYQDLDQASLLQMIGRAGRPGFDTSGTAVIMTDTDSKKKFQALASSGLRPAISQCRGERLVETMNTEVSQRVITSSESAIRWFQGSLSFIQTVRNPNANGISVVSAHSIDTHCLQLCRGAIQQLQEIGALLAGDGQQIFPLPASHVMSRHLVEYRAMQRISQIPFDATTHQVLKALAQIEGLQRPVRRSEKKALNAAHKALKLYKLEGPPSKVRVQEPWEKSFVLIQAYIEQVEMQCDYALRQEMACMVEYASRMLAAIEEYSAQGSKNFNVVVQSLKIRRAMAVHLWNGNDGLLRQIKGISQKVCYSLHIAGISTFHDVVKSREETIEKAANRSPPFGADLKNACSKILSARLKVSATVETATTGGTPSSLMCNLERQQSAEAPSTMGISNGQGTAVTYSLVVYTDRPNGGLYFKENIVGPEAFRVLVPPRFGNITLKLVASIVGLDDSFTVDGNDEKSASARIRNANKKKRDTATVQDPRIHRKQPTTAAKQQKQKGPQRLRQSRHKLAPSHQASVTPSPKPPPTTVAAARGQKRLIQNKNGGDVETGANNRTSDVEFRFQATRNYSASATAAAVTQDTATLQAKQPTFKEDMAWGPQATRTTSNTAAHAVTQDPVALQATQRRFRGDAVWRPHATRTTSNTASHAVTQDPVALQATQRRFRGDAVWRPHATRTTSNTASHAVTQDPVALQATQRRFRGDAVWRPHATRTTSSAPEPAATHDRTAPQATQPVFEREAALGTQVTRTTFSTAMRRSVQQASSQSLSAVAPPAIDFDTSGARENTLKRAANQSPHGSDSRFSIGAVAWKRAKQRHQKQQQRAFVHKALNPFSGFKHDPNDSEAILDTLSSQSRSPRDGIIPASALAQNRYASKLSTARTMPQQSFHRPSHHQGRQRGYPSHSMSTQELLAEKAEEANAGLCHKSPPWGASSQDWCLHSKEMHQPWGTGNHSLEPHCVEQLYGPDGWNGGDPCTDYCVPNNSGYGEFRNEAYGQIQQSDPTDHGSSFTGWQNTEIFRGEPAAEPLGPAFPPSQQNSWDNQNDGLGGHGDESFESAYFY